MDALSEYLKSVQFEGAVFIDAEFTAPWCIWSSFDLPVVKQRLAGVERLLFFHFLVEGNCEIRANPQSDVLKVGAGDIILFPRGDRHLMGSDTRLAPIDAERLDQTEASLDLGANLDMIRVRFDGSGSTTHFVCGYIAGMDSVCRTLFDGLPRVVRIPLGDTPASFIHELLKVAVRESFIAAPGSTTTLAKLSELMFVESLRRYVQNLPNDGSGWFAAIRDRQIGRTLALLHGEPEKPWTLAMLAGEVALSPSALRGRFTAMVGESPIRYLQRWRLALAQRTLRFGSEPIIRVAERAGYDSEAAFNRAFRREFGTPPDAWRKRARRGVTAAT